MDEGSEVPHHILMPSISSSFPTGNLRPMLGIFLDGPQGGIPSDLTKGVVHILQISLLFLVNKNIGIRKQWHMSSL